MSLTDRGSFTHFWWGLPCLTFSLPCTAHECSTKLTPEEQSFNTGINSIIHWVTDAPPAHTLPTRGPITVNYCSCALRTTGKPQTSQRWLVGLWGDISLYIKKQRKTSQVLNTGACLTVPAHVSQMGWEVPGYFLIAPASSSTALEWKHSCISFSCQTTTLPEKTRGTVVTWTYATCSFLFIYLSLLLLFSRRLAVWFVGVGFPLSHIWRESGVAPQLPSAQSSDGETAVPLLMRVAE